MIGRLPPRMPLAQMCILLRVGASTIKDCLAFMEMTVVHLRDEMILLQSTQNLR
jgi:hypothetical protein